MSETEFLIGVVDFPVAKKLVFADTNIVELSAPYNNGPPKIKAAKKWREEAPLTHSFSIQVPRFLFETPPPNTPLPGKLENYGEFRTTEENVSLFEKTLEFARGLGSSTLVFLTPPEFTPTKNHRSALKDFLAAVPKEGYSLVWEPHGPWENETAFMLARELGLTLAVDPLRDTPYPGPDNTAYFRLGPFAAMGSRLGIYELEKLIEAGREFERVTCVFQTPRALDDARNMKRTLEETDA